MASEESASPEPTSETWHTIETSLPLHPVGAGGHEDDGVVRSTLIGPNAPAVVQLPRVSHTFTAGSVTCADVPDGTAVEKVIAAWEVSARPTPSSEATQWTVTSVAVHPVGVGLHVTSGG